MAICDFAGWFLWYSKKEPVIDEKCSANQAE